jgi:UDP-perosamine 4-acetyltransferase
MRVVGIGAGGHAKVLIDVLRLHSKIEIVGLTDSAPELWHTSVLGVPVLGDDSLLPRLLAQGVRGVFIGVGGRGDNTPRRRLYEHVHGLGFQSIAIIHSMAVIASDVTIGLGPMIMAGAIVNPGVRICDNVIINTGAIVEHDCLIGNHVHVATGARLASTVRVGDGAHIGAGATIRQCITIGENAIVGAGAVVVKDVSPGSVVVGVPARSLRVATRPKE